jgi:hypothetical protein
MSATIVMAVERTGSKRTGSRAAGTAEVIVPRATPVRVVVAKMTIILGIVEVVPLLIEPFR